MEKSTEFTRRLPQSFCAFCEKKTPHVHQRLAVNRVQVIRSLCLICNREQPKDHAETQVRLPRPI